MYVGMYICIYVSATQAVQKRILYLLQIESQKAMSCLTRVWDSQQEDKVLLTTIHLSRLRFFCSCISYPLLTPAKDGFLYGSDSSSYELILKRNY